MTAECAKCAHDLFWMRAGFVVANAAFLAALLILRRAR